MREALDRVAPDIAERLLLLAIGVARAEHFAKPTLRKRTRALAKEVREAGMLHLAWDEIMQQDVALSQATGKGKSTNCDGATTTCAAAQAEPQEVAA